jgi:hypothetical protein
MEVEITAASDNRNFDHILPITAVEAAIQAVAERVNYGVEQGQHGLSKIPAALCLWRWEVKDPSLLPNQIRDKAESRKAERTTAQKEIKSLLEPMSPEERALALGLKNLAISKEKPSLLASASSSSVRFIQKYEEHQLILL